jgi:hypothetical protein
MNSRLLLFCFFLCISCEEKETEVVITGKVTDSVSGSGVEEAIVALKIDFCEDGRCYTQTISGTGSTTGTDGSFAINFRYKKDQPVLFKGRTFPFPLAYNVFATKAGYITSDDHSLNDNIFDNADIKLYHSSQLNVHVKNEGINNVEAVRVCIDRGLGFTIFGTPQFIFQCKGYDFDSVFVLKNLWGGFSYACKVIPITGSTYNPMPYVNKTIFLIPETINELSISY